MSNEIKQSSITQAENVNKSDKDTSLFNVNSNNDHLIQSNACNSLPKIKCFVSKYAYPEILNIFFEKFTEQESFRVENKKTGDFFEYRTTDNSKSIAWEYIKIMQTGQKDFASKAEIKINNNVSTEEMLAVIQNRASSSEHNKEWLITYLKYHNLEYNLYRLKREDEFFECRKPMNVRLIKSETLKNMFDYNNFLVLAHESLPKKDLVSIFFEILFNQAISEKTKLRLIELELLLKITYDYSEFHTLCKILPCKFDENPLTEKFCLMHNISSRNSTASISIGENFSYTMCVPSEFNLKRGMKLFCHEFSDEHSYSRSKLENEKFLPDHLDMDDLYANSTYVDFYASLRKSNTESSVSNSTNYLLDKSADLPDTAP